MSEVSRLVIPGELPPVRSGVIRGPDDRVLSRVTTRRMLNLRLRRIDENGRPVGDPVEVDHGGSMTEIERDPPDDDTPIDLGSREFTVEATYDLTPELRRLIYGDLWTP